MAALIPFILVGLLAWLLYGVLWTDRARAARVIAAPEGEAAGLDPAELWPGVGILRPTAATIRLAIGGLVVAGVLGLGLIAYVLAENDFPIGPMILAVILGPVVESNFMRSMIKSGGDLSALFERPIAAGLGGLAILVWLAIIGSTLWATRRTARHHLST